MLHKTILIGSLLATLAAGPGRSTVQDRGLESLVPPPSWIIDHVSELGLSREDFQVLYRQLADARREIASLRGSVQQRRGAFDDALRAQPFDAGFIEARFDDLLEAESALKRASLRARLRVLSSVSADQRGALRAEARRTAELRGKLRWRIEEVRRAGKRLRERGYDTNAIRAQVREIEQLIRAGDLEEALAEAEQLLGEMHQ